jgi:hypothetical protein
MGHQPEIDQRCHIRDKPSHDKAAPGQFARNTEQLRNEHNYDAPYRGSTLSSCSPLLPLHTEGQGEKDVAGKGQAYHQGHSEIGPTFSNLSGA